MIFQASDMRLQVARRALSPPLVEKQPAPRKGRIVMKHRSLADAHARRYRHFYDADDDAITRREYIKCDFRIVAAMNDTLGDRIDDARVRPMPRSVL